MKSILKSATIVFLFLVSTAFFFHDQDGNFGGPLARNDNNSRVIQTEREFAMMADLPAGDSRQKGLPAGIWGGDHISMEVTSRGAAIEYDCAHAMIEKRIVLDARGRFNVSGMQVPEHGGPVTRDEQAAGYPARFAGQVKGGTMTLTVSNSATKELIGTFTLVKDVEARLRKCR